MQRVGSPTAGVRLAPTLDRLQSAQAQAYDDPTKKCCRLARDIEPAQEGVLAFCRSQVLNRVGMSWTTLRPGGRFACEWNTLFH
jgi:hypothetical protein